MTDLMSAPTSTSRLFQAILRRKGAGTLRIGRALRLLGRANRSALQDVTEELEHVQTWNQLIRVLAQASQECALLEASTPFFLLPNEQDAQILFADVEQSNPQTIATFLILLSVLDYPTERGKPPAKEPMLLHACTL